jgi:hypothetical protein
MVENENTQLVKLMHMLQIVCCMSEPQQFGCVSETPSVIDDNNGKHVEKHQQQLVLHTRWVCAFLTITATASCQPGISSFELLTLVSAFSRPNLFQCLQGIQGPTCPTIICTVHELQCRSGLWPLVCLLN